MPFRRYSGEAGGGERGPPGTGNIHHDRACTVAAFGGPGVPVFTGRNKRGQDTKHGFLSPLDSPYLPSR